MCVNFWYLLRFSRRADHLLHRRRTDSAFPHAQATLLRGHQLRRCVPATDAGPRRAGLYLHHPIYGRAEGGCGDRADHGVDDELRADSDTQLLLQSRATVLHEPRKSPVCFVNYIFIAFKL